MKVDKNIIPEIIKYIIVNIYQTNASDRNIFL